MKKILVPVDGSPSSLHALATAIAWLRESPEFQLHVITVQMSIASGNVKRFISAETLQTYYEEEAEKSLESARKLLSDAGVEAQVSWHVGSVADTIVDYATKAECSHIIMGTRGMGGWSNLLLGSVATKVLSLVNIPVTLVK